MALTPSNGKEIFSLAMPKLSADGFIGMELLMPFGSEIFSASGNKVTITESIEPVLLSSNEDSGGGIRARIEIPHRDVSGCEYFTMLEG